MNCFIILSCLFQIILSIFENPIKNANFSNGLTGWYTETISQLEMVEGTSGTKAIKMTRTSLNDKNPFIAQWPKWPINQKYNLGMRYKANYTIYKF